ncbi:fatty acid desaturase, type 1 protein [Tanacetum coccineum]
MSLVSPTIPDDEKKARMSELEKMRRGGFWFRKWSFVDMITLCWMVGIHVLAASALFVFDWGAFIVATGLAFWTGIGIVAITICKKDPISWVSIHRKHHKYTETDRDPHSPNEGFWFSHMGWLCYNDYIVAKCGESSNVPELKLQWFYRFLHSTYFWHPSALAVLLYHYGGFPYLAWGLDLGGWHVIVSLRSSSVCLRLMWHVSHIPLYLLAFGFNIFYRGNSPLPKKTYFGMYEIVLAARLTVTTNTRKKEGNKVSCGLAVTAPEPVSSSHYWLALPVNSKGTTHPYRVILECVVSKYSGMPYY